MLESYREHVNVAKEQRDHYNQQGVISKDFYRSLPEDNKAGGNAPCSVPGQNHYSWDFAQQVHFPHHAQQVGPIYFQTPRKCHVFGVCSEGSEKQVFYLVDEAQLPGKGANSVVSMAHHYLTHHGLGECQAVINFDNCCGQNKNNAVLWYGLWRVLTGLHESLEFAMMVTGHTKFAPDWHFGVWKIRWRASDAESLEEIAASVQRSSKTGHNVPQLVDDPTRPVTFYNWREFLGGFFKPLKNITKFHHFSMCVNEPGIVTCKVLVSSEEQKFNLLKRNPTVGMPAVIISPELDIDRQWYLYDSIRDFFRSEKASDSACPKPVQPKTHKTKGNNADDKPVPCKISGKRRSALLN